MKVGITGIKGFIGKSLAEKLTSKNIKVFGFDLPEDNLLDSSSLKKFLFNKDLVIHAAAVNRGSDTEIISAGVVGTYNLVSNSRSRIIFLSSIQAENNTVFGLTKRISEILVEDFSIKNKIPASVFRVPNVFGENCRPFYNSVVATFSYQINRNQKIKISKDQRKIPLIYVKDLAEIVVKESLNKRKGFFFKEITSKNQTTVSELACLLKSFKKIKNKKELKSKFHRDLYQTFLSYSK
jgi:UDP-2-acetamido-2,6-beta-L-arabino-hexul-4-ose reductase